MNKAIKTVDRYRLPGTMKVYAYSELYQCYENQGRLADALAALAAYDSLARMMDQAYLRADCYKGSCAFTQNWATRRKRFTTKTSISTTPTR